MFSATTPLIKQFIIDNVAPRCVTKQMIALFNDVFIPFCFKNQFEIKDDEDVFIPATMMRKYVHEYQRFRDACFVMKMSCDRKDPNNFRRPGGAKCISIIGLKEPFKDLCVSIAKTIISQQKKLKKKSKIIYVTTMVGNRAKKANDFNHLETHNFYPGSPMKNPHNYTKTENSHRFFCWAAGLPKTVVKELYAGVWDFDIVQCYPNIFYKHFGMVHPWMEVIVNDREVWYQYLINENCFTYELACNRKMTDRDKAKAMTIRLFHPDIANRKPLKKIGDGLYDAVADSIYNALAQSDIKTAHLFFSEVEAGLMRLAFDIIGHDRVLVNVHDGLRANVPDQEIDDILNNLFKATGFKWTAKKLEPAAHHPTETPPQKGSSR